MPVAIARLRPRQRAPQAHESLFLRSQYLADAPGTIEVAWRVERGQVHIDVDDSAPGVNEADLARLFEPLYRADAARSRERGGSGLGLAICAAIVQTHGGPIAAHPSVLGGLRIEVVLPCRAEHVQR